MYKNTPHAINMRGKGILLRYIPQSKLLHKESNLNINALPRVQHLTP
nr:MAG TPA: hypothetical protein [Caudoviricetes sp.]